MATILDRMRAERRVTVLILAILVAVSLAFRLFFPVPPDPAAAQPEPTLYEKL